MITLQPYRKDDASAWNALVDGSKNGTFLFDRRFMDYHADRFDDCSLLFRQGSRLLACLPANFCADEQTVYTHQGLTYGGLVMADSVGATDVLHIFGLLTDYYRHELAARRFVCKPVPHIYCTQPSDEPLYALHRFGAQLTARGLSSAVSLRHPLPLQARRRSGIRKAEAAALRIERTDAAADYEAFHHIVATGLRQRHGVEPVHSAAEMLLLAARFPQNIHLYVERTADGSDIVAGAWLFVTRRVVHTQYMAASEAGRGMGALDYLIANLIDRYRNVPDLTTFDFGISTEEGGRVLNEGLIFQKEGFGGRGVCYDQWTLEL